MAFHNYTLCCYSLLLFFLCVNTHPTGRHVLARHLNNIEPMIGRHIMSSQPITSRHLSSLVPSTPLVLTYHNGTLLTGNSESRLLLHLLWYGSFTSSQRSIVTDFLNSFDKPMGHGHAAPSVWSWWKIARSYVDRNNASVASMVKLGAQFSDVGYSMGKSLKQIHMETLLLKAIKAKSLPPFRSNTLYVVLSAADVLVEHFCMDSCGFHDHYTFHTHSAKSKLQLPFAWVGNAATQCPGLCAWPFAIPAFGPPNPPLLPPNQDVGMDGMIINLAILLAGAATNPFGTGYFQGEASLPLEAATACAGSFGPGSYPGYPGELLTDNLTKTNFNAWGISQRKYLLPALWSPPTFSCSTPT